MNLLKLSWTSSQIVGKGFSWCLLFPYFFQTGAVLFGTGEISDVDFFNNCSNQTLVDTDICDIWLHINLLSGIKVNKKNSNSKVPEISLPQDASTHLTNINIRKRWMGRNRGELVDMEHWFLFFQSVHTEHLVQVGILVWMILLNKFVQLTTRRGVRIPKFLQQGPAHHGLQYNPSWQI